MHQEEKKFLSLLQVTVPPDTGLTVASEIKILEMLGIVSNPELVNAMHIASSMIPPATQATLHGLITLLSNMVKQHPKATKAHHDALSALLKSFTGVPDSVLTFGTFLPICEALMKAPAHKFGKAA